MSDGIDYEYLYLPDHQPCEHHVPAHDALAAMQPPPTPDDYEAERQPQVMPAGVREAISVAYTHLSASLTIGDVVADTDGSYAQAERILGSWLSSTAQPVAQPQDAPDEVDCDYWFEGEITFRGQTKMVRDSFHVQRRNSGGNMDASSGMYFYMVEQMRGKWYKRDKAPWHGQKEGDNE